MKYVAKKNAQYQKGDIVTFIWRPGEAPVDVTILEGPADMAYNTGRGYKCKYPDGKVRWVAEDKLSAKTNSAKHNCTNCPKIGFGKKILSMVNAVVHGTRPKTYSCRFMAPGLTNYLGENGKPETWYLSREVMTSMQNSFIGCPVVAETKHEAGSVPEDFDARVKKGDYDGVITGVKTNAQDGWDYATFIVWDPEVQEQIEQDGFNVSCAFNTIESLPGGILNQVPYDAEVKKGEYIHMAIVGAPRQTGARIFLNNIDSKEPGAIMFNMNGKGYKLFPKGKMNSVIDDARKAIEGGASLEETVNKIAEERKLSGEEKIRLAAELTKKNAQSDIELKSLIEQAIDEKVPLEEIVHRLDEKGINYDRIQALIQDIMKGRYIKKNVAPEGWEETIKGMKKHPEIDNPFALAWWMKDKGYKGNEDLMESWKKFNEGGSEMKCNKCGKLMSECNCNANEIDPEKAIIGTPDGDVPLKDMINAYQAAKKNSKKVMGKNSAGADVEYENQDEYEEYKKLSPEAQKAYDAAIEAGEDHKGALKKAATGKENAGDKKIGLEDEFEGVKVNEMYNAWKAMKKNADEDKEVKELQADLATAKEKGDEEGAKKIQERIDGLKKNSRSDDLLEGYLRAKGYGKDKDATQHPEEFNPEQIKTWLKGKVKDEEINAVIEDFERLLSGDTALNSLKVKVAAETKKNADDRRAKLKEEGKSDEEIEKIMKSEADATEEERKKKEEEEKVKTAAAEAEGKEAEAKKAREHFNSLKNARNQHKEEVATDNQIISKSERAKIVRKSKEY